MEQILYLIFSVNSQPVLFFAPFFFLSQGLNLPLTYKPQFVLYVI